MSLSRAVEMLKIIYIAVGIIRMLLIITRVREGRPVGTLSTVKAPVLHEIGKKCSRRADRKNNYAAKHSTMFCIVGRLS